MIALFFCTTSFGKTYQAVKKSKKKCHSSIRIGTVKYTFPTHPHAKTLHSYIRMYSYSVLTTYIRYVRMYTVVRCLLYSFSWCTYLPYQIGCREVVSPIGHLSLIRYAEPHLKLGTGLGGKTAFKISTRTCIGTQF